MSVQRTVNKIADIAAFLAKNFYVWTEYRTEFRVYCQWTLVRTLKFKGLPDSQSATVALPLKLLLISRFEVDGVECNALVQRRPLCMQTLQSRLFANFVQMIQR